MDITNIPISEIHEDNDFNCRGKVAVLEVHDLIESIRENGLKQPLLIRKYSDERRETTGFRFGLVAGYRRFKALKSLHHEFVPCVVEENLSDTKARILNLIENVVRKDLNILQEAKAIEKLKIAGLTLEDVAKELHKSPGWVQIRFRLLDLPEDIQEEVGKGVITQTHINALASLPKDKMYEQVKAIKNKKMSGERGIVIKRPTYYNSKRARTRAEINLMLDHIYTTLGASFATRALAWCVGNIGSAEMFREIKAQCDERNIPYDIPEEEL